MKYTSMKDSFKEIGVDEMKAINEDRKKRNNIDKIKNSFLGQECFCR